MSTPTHTPPRWRHRVLALLAVAVAAVPALSPDGTAEAAVPSNNVFPIASPGAACNDDFGVPRPRGRTHEGVDCFQEPSRGKPLVAVESGTMRTYSTVNPSDRCAGSGNAVQLVGDSVTWYYYGHLDRIIVGSGRVTRGQQIGTIGDTGNACGRPHLHFPMKLSSSSRPIDPHPYVSTWPIVSPGGGGGGTGDSYQPTGRLDSVNARGAGTIGLYGWSFDPDTRTQSIPVDVLIVKSNGTRQTIRLTANKLRTDIGAAYPGAGNYHGFELVLSGLPRGSTMVQAFGIDSSNRPGDYTSLGTRWVTVP